MPVAAAVLAMVVGRAHAENWERTFPIEGTPDLRVASDHGHVRIVTWKRPEIRARVIGRGWTIGHDGLRVSGEQHADAVRIEVLLPRWGYSPEWTRRSIEIVIHMPDSALVDIETEDADISLPAMRGRFRLRTWDGLISSDGLAGLIEMRTGNGSIRARKVNGSVSAVSSDGSIEVDGRFDRLELESRDGDILTRIGRGSRIDSNGSIETTDGHVWVELPHDMGVDIEAGTQKGRIELGELRERGVRKRPARIQKQLNGGGPALTIASVSGDIRIEQREVPRAGRRH